MNEELWKRTKRPRTDLQIRKCKWGWLGHTMRNPSDDIARQALVEWNHQGKRGRADRGTRTVHGEERGLKKPRVKKTWMEIKTDATNRVRRRIFVEALCSAAESRDVIYIINAPRASLCVSSFTITDEPVTVIIRILFSCKNCVGRSLRLRGLRRGSAAARLVGFRVRIPPEVWMCVSCVVCRQVSATGRSFINRSPTECGVSECNHKAPIMRRLWPTRAVKP